MREITNKDSIQQTDKLKLNHYIRYGVNFMENTIEKFLDALPPPPKTSPISPLPIFFALLVFVIRLKY